jgi:heat shock protein HtpX
MSKELQRQQRRLFLQAAGLTFVMVYLSVRAAGLLTGTVGAGITVVAVAVLAVHGVSTQRLLLPSGTRRLTWYDTPQLHRDLSLLCDRAGLRNVPPVYLIPSRHSIAFTTGVGTGAFLVVSRGLMESLGPRELRAVLAHEVSHIRNHDLPLFALVGAMQRITRLVSSVLLVLVLVGFPLLVMGLLVLPARALLYLGVVPLVSVFAQMALLRTREFQADLGAVNLTGDPFALARALYTIDAQQRGLWELRWPAQMLRTHPSTRERIDRLRRLFRAEDGA